MITNSKVASARSRTEGSEMPLIGFSVFHDEVKDGTKRQTIRKHRKFPVKAGDILFLYWHLRRKDCQLLRVEKCVETFAMPFRTLKVSEDIAKRDGFESSVEMCNWLRKNHHLSDEEISFDIIRW
jgi:hypothetical protein